MISVFGISNVGKSTLLKKVRESFGDEVGIVSVGAEMSRRHPPEAFKGKACLDETEAEVWEIFDAQYHEALAKGASVILCDGQPRSVRQVDHMLANYPRLSVLWLHADQDALVSRAVRRADAELRYERLTNDRLQLFDVVHKLHEEDIKIHTIDTSMPTEHWVHHCLTHIRLAGLYGV